MEELLFFLFAMALLTVVGHGIWILVAAIIRLVFGSRPVPNHEAPDVEADRRAFDRMLRYLHWQGKITGQQMDQLRQASGLSAPPATDGHEQLLTPSPGTESASPSESTLVSALVEPELVDASTSATTPNFVHPLDAPDDPPVSTDRAAQSRRAIGAVLQSFLASNNIRWGELIAGLLIVTCSIGLVISLWNTLTQTHRLMPSLIFLLGTAGIEAAGLYTLRRWNLKDTSRVVLIIATLLIPLNVVAGIALASGEGSSVQLTQPLTMAAIAVAVAGYLAMLWMSGRAILGGNPLQLPLVVGAPALMMPLMPSAIRSMGSSAAWLSLIPAMLVGFVIASRIGESTRSKLTSAAAWRFVLLVGIGFYSLAVALGFFVVRLDGEFSACVTLAIATLPVVLAIMATFHRLQSQLSGESSQKLRLLASVAEMMMALIVVAMFPLTLSDPSQLMAWSAITAITSVALALGLRQSNILYVACGAVSLGVLLLGSTQLSGRDWASEMPLWRRVVGGEGVIMLIGLAIVWSGLALLLRRLGPAWTSPPLRAAVAGGAMGIVTTAAVALGPPAWCGVVPQNVILSLLFVQAMLLAFPVTARFPLAMHGAVAMFAVLYLNVFRPAEGWLAESAAIQSPLMFVVLGTMSSMIAVVAAWHGWAFAGGRCSESGRLRPMDPLISRTLDFGWAWITGLALIGAFGIAWIGFDNFSAALQWFALTELVIAGVFASIVALWYRRDDCGIVSAVLLLVAIVSSGMAQLAEMTLLSILGLFGIGCLSLVIAQRLASRLGPIDRLRRWQVPVSSDCDQGDAFLASHWPADWSFILRCLATLGVGFQVVLSLTTAGTQAMLAGGAPLSTGLLATSSIATCLLALAFGFWLWMPRTSNRVTDFAIALLMAAPILAPVFTGPTPLPDAAWPVVLILWVVASAIAMVASMGLDQKTLVSATVALIGCVLTTLGCVLGGIAGHPASETLLYTWLVSIVIGMLVTINRGDRGSMRVCGGITSLVGVVWIIVFSEEMNSVWERLQLGNGDASAFLAGIAWLLGSGTAWRVRYISLRRAATDSLALGRFSVDSVLLIIGSIAMSLATLPLVVTINANYLADFDQSGLSSWLCMGLAWAAAGVSIARWDRTGQFSVSFILEVCCVVWLTRWLLPASLPASLTFAIVAVVLSLLTVLGGWVLPLHRQLQLLVSQWRLPWSPEYAAVIERQWVGWLMIALAATLLGSVGAVGFDIAPVSRWLWIASLVAVAISIGRTGGQKASHGLRTISVGSLCAAAMIGSVADVRGETFGASRQLVQILRLFIASVWLIPLVGWGAPRYFALDADRWRIPLRRGAVMSAAVAMIALIGSLMTEAMLRDEASGISEIPSVIVIAACTMTGIFSLLCLGLAIAPGRFLAASAQRLSVSNRQALVYGGQVLMLLAWLHVFLCRPDWAMVGIREYWPYLVMLLAFASAGVTHWARTRENDVLAGPLRNTTMYLPLIPILGFWLSSGRAEWTFGGGAVSYTGLLAAAAIFYLGLGSLWPRDRIARVGGIVLGNAALWAMLAQHPGWGFLMHPQLWLIPPAVCVLIAVHLQQGTLNPALVTACRYGATLTIYVSSTADMLVQQIGTNLWGPIVLITLALIGAVIGVVLQVRAFLYLGTTFVLMGLIGMVWHAQRAIDQVWPWWAFGITMGLLLLAGLTYVEKNKDMLRVLVARLNQWDA